MSASAESALAKTQVEDGQQTHELTKRKLLSPDIQRISSIFESCTNKIEIVAILDSVVQSNHLSRVVDKSLSRALQEHQILAERLDMQDGLKQKPGGKQNGEGKEVSMRAKAQLESDIKNSVREILRHVRNHPDAVLGLRAELALEITESERLLMSEIKNASEKLQLSVEEDLELVRHKQMSLSDVPNMVSLKDEITKALTEVENQILEKNRKIEDLQSSLQDKRKEEAELSRRPVKPCQSHAKTKKQISIELEMNDLSNQLKELILENGKAEREHRLKNEKVETEIEYVFQNFDDKMEEIQANLELNEIEYKRQEEELRKLQKPFSVLEMEYNQIKERRQLEEKRKDEMRELELRLTKAAILAQAWWRGYSVRKALKKNSNGKKAKKGKGKKAKTAEGKEVKQTRK